jgi:hypothetical protein
MHQPTVKLTLRLPAALHEKLRQRAQANSQSLNLTALEAMREGLSQSTISYANDEERVWRALRESGLWEPLGPEWLEGMEDVPVLTHEEIRELMKGVAPLSDIIIEDRGPR